MIEHIYHITVSLHTLFTTVVPRKRDSQDSLCWLGADVHLDLDGIPYRRPGIFLCEAVVYGVRSKFGRGDKGVGVDDVVGMYAGGREGEGRVACARSERLWR